ncbi:MAG: type II toxin-antitoxin system VapC family toxin [Chthoniobacter sp.]|uniref:type II toxin-antitoxin system VapC family toxin n=1 Tax=Chthoniobacter sp. TaxID=2510640 RepID=UPI0032A2EE0A
MKPRLYLETTIPSYLVARRSGLARISADQQTTQDWWDFRRGDYDIFISEVVLDESAMGDPVMAAARLEKLAGLPQLTQSPAVDQLAERIVEHGVIPLSAAPDAMHIALAAVHAMNFLLTWNCKHIANAFNRRRLETLCQEAGFECPVICTPVSLMET